MAGGRKGISGPCSRTGLDRSDINRVCNSSEEPKKLVGSRFRQGANHALFHPELLPRRMTGGDTTLLYKKGDKS
eukprot:7237088-Ditylum_brightwellii.AAC.1